MKLRGDNLVIQWLQETQGRQPTHPTQSGVLFYTKSPPFHQICKLYTHGDKYTIILHCHHNSKHTQTHTEFQSYCINVFCEKLV